MEEDGEDGVRIREDNIASAGRKSRLDRTLEMWRQVEAKYGRARMRLPVNKKPHLVPFPAVLNRSGVMHRDIWTLWAR